MRSRRLPPALALLALLAGCRSPERAPAPAPQPQPAAEAGSRPGPAPIVPEPGAPAPSASGGPETRPDPSGPAAPPAASWPPGAKELDSNAGGFVLRYACEPAAIPINEPFRMLVGVEGPEGPARLAVDGWMPEHLHGLVRRPVVHELAPGRWAVEGLLLHMPGRWQLFFDLTRGARTERAQDELELD